MLRRHPIKHWVDGNAARLMITSWNVEQLAPSSLALHALLRYQKAIR
jgi:hypothetical protein